MENGRSRKYKGSILLTAIFLVSFMSMLSLLLLSNYRVVTEFSFRTRQYYEMKIMTHLFLADYPLLSSEEQKEGQIKYNKGAVVYRLENEQLVVTAMAGKYKYVHYETVSQEIETSLSTTETETDIAGSMENE
ncbi:competence type IV pilus minor pilin ComGG [Enterococcus olivae]